MRLALLIAASICAPPALAQSPSPPDTAETPRLSAVVVTGDRGRNTISSSVSAVARLSGPDLARVPHATLADLLRLVPGFTVVDFDGLGYDPQLMVRGFYGGGEAEYVVVLVDGRSVGELHTGRAAWDVLPPLSSIDAVEVVRGSASPLYGDAAVGGVINIITRAGGQPAGLRWGASGGTYGTLSANLDARASPAWRNLSLGGGLDRTDGFRQHAQRTAGRARASLALAEGTNGRLALTARSHWREFDEPGPLLASLMNRSRRASDPLFRFDRTTDRSHTMELDGWRRLGGGAQLSGSVSGEIRSTDAIRTLALAPGFGDTKERDASNGRAAGTVQLEFGDSPLPGTDRVTVGLEGSHGTLDSRYYRVVTGTRSDYEAASGERQDLDAHGASTRTVGSLYGQYTVQPVSVLRLTIGGRLDELHDTFDPKSGDGTRPETATHSAFSPRVGVNLRYLNQSRSAGNLYASVSRSFKAPTLDQLYDLRSIPVPEPPFAIRTSNPELIPQHGTSIEAGLYHGVELSSAVRGGVSISAYQMDMENELDFDVESFRYVNIGRSRHRGVEVGADVASGWSSAFANFTLQAAVARSGQFAGNRLKAIPRQSLNVGLSMRPRRMLDASLLVTHLRDIYLDDANTVELPDYTRLDARLTLGAAGLGVVLDIRNILDARYSSSGFLDPSGSGEAYFYPAAGRVIELGVRGGW